MKCEAPARYLLNKPRRWLYADCMEEASAEVLYGGDGMVVNMCLGHLAYFIAEVEPRSCYLMLDQAS